MPRKKTNRTIDLKWIDPNELKDSKNSKNWKTHKKRQQDTVRSLIARHGWARPLLFNSRTNRLIDGHGRLDIAIKDGVSEIPVLVGDWSEEAEEELLASLDTTGMMADFDQGALDSLTRSIGKNIENLIGQDHHADNLLKSMIDLNSFASTMNPRSPILKRYGAKRKLGDTKLKKVPKSKKQRKVQKEKTLSQYVSADGYELFPSTNEYGIPDLKPSLLWGHNSDDLEMEPLRTFNGEPDTHAFDTWYCFSTKSKFKDKPPGGYLSFYTEDFYFDRLYSNPHLIVPRILDWEFNVLVEPDFSTYWSWPWAARLWNVYRSRWAARHLQANGTPIIPTIRRTDDPQRDAPWLYHTLPSSCPALAINVGMRHKMGTEERKNSGKIIQACLETAIAHCRPKLVYVYGGVDLEKYLIGYLPKGKDCPDYLLIQSYIRARNVVLDQKTRKNSHQSKKANK